VKGRVLVQDHRKQQLQESMLPAAAAVALICRDGRLGAGVRAIQALRQLITLSQDGTRASRHALPHQRSVSASCCLFMMRALAAHSAVGRQAAPVNPISLKVSAVRPSIREAIAELQHARTLTEVMLWLSPPY
jgi:hypothetical protein